MEGKNEEVEEREEREEWEEVKRLTFQVWKYHERILVESEANQRVSITC